MELGGGPLQCERLRKQNEGSRVADGSRFPQRSRGYGRSNRQRRTTATLQGLGGHCRGKDSSRTSTV